MDNWLERTELLLGKEKLDLLRQAHVLVVGLGGVGAYAAEMIARAGVGRMTIADADTVAPNNIKPPAGGPAFDRRPAEGRGARRPAAGHQPRDRADHRQPLHPDEETYTLLDAAAYDFVVDAIDTLSPSWR